VHCAHAHANPGEGVSIITSVGMVLDHPSHELLCSENMFGLLLRFMSSVSMIPIAESVAATADSHRDSFCKNK
jgi:hypothetical protein